jgi:hypothetical protein
MADAKRIDGKAFAANLRKAMAEKVAELRENHGLTRGPGQRCLCAK